MDYLIRVLYMQYDLAKEYEKKVPESAALLHKGYILGLQKAIKIIKNEEFNYPKILGIGCDLYSPVLSDEMYKLLVNKKFR